MRDVSGHVGAVHLNWDVVAVAAGGGGLPIRPLTVEGSYTTPAYLLADSTGGLHTKGVAQGRGDLGLAIADVREIIGYREILVAGATWPVPAVYRARLFNPLGEIAGYAGRPDLLALPYPDHWPAERVDQFVALVETQGVGVEPVPESIALAGYVRACGLLEQPAGGATVVYCDGRGVLVVGVHADDYRPTESIGVPLPPAASSVTEIADRLVYETIGAARAIQADTAQLVLVGNVCFNTVLRNAFRNHNGPRLRVVEHPLHAIALGAASIVAAEIDVRPAPSAPMSWFGTEEPPTEPAPRHGRSGPPVLGRDSAPRPASRRSTGPEPDATDDVPGRPTGVSGRSELWERVKGGLFQADVGRPTDPDRTVRDRRRAY